METHETILDFWFGWSRDDLVVAQERSNLWWSKNPTTDREIRRRFESLVLAAESGTLDQWLFSNAGRLALILLTDQFPRNMYRDTPDAFRFDPIARRTCLAGLKVRIDLELRPIERVFIYLPLEHSEDRLDQELCVALFRKLAADVPENHRQTFETYLEFAVRHQDVIERFGRFPHRNAILGRESTDEEVAFLTQPGSSF